MVVKDIGREKKIMCFVEDDETESLLRSIHYGNYGLVPDIQRGDVTFAVDYIKDNHSPDILLIDLSDSAMPLSQISALAEVCEPSVEVIAIGQRNEVGVYRDLIKAGVRDYLVKPLPVAILNRILTEITQSDTEKDQFLFQKSGKVIAVIGARGGIGVSSIVANMGVGLSEKKLKRVALFDLDLHLGSLSQYLDVDPSPGLSQLLDLPERIDPSLIERYMGQYTPNLRILNTQLSAKESPSLNPESLESIFQALASRFHFVLLDIPRQPNSPFHVEALKRSNIVMIVTDYSISSLKNTNFILEMLGGNAYYNQEILIIVNKKNEYVEGEIDRELFEESIERPVTLEINFDKQFPLKALRDGIPVIIDDKGDFAKGIDGVMAQLTGGGGEVSEVQNSFWHYFFKK